MSSFASSFFSTLPQDTTCLYTRKSAKEISSILGFEDLPAFSRFFKKMTGESVSDYRKRVKREELPTVAE